MSYVSAFIRSPGGSVAWPQVAAVMDSEAVAALNAAIEQNPDAPSLLELMPVMEMRGA